MDSVFQFWFGNYFGIFAEKLKTWKTVFPKRSRKRFSIWIQFFSFSVLLHHMAGTTVKLFFESLFITCHLFCIYHLYMVLPQKKLPKSRVCVKHCKYHCFCTTHRFFWGATICIYIYIYIYLHRRIKYQAFKNIFHIESSAARIILVIARGYRLKSALESTSNTTWDLQPFPQWTLISGFPGCVLQSVVTWRWFKKKTCVIYFDRGCTPGYLPPNFRSGSGFTGIGPPLSRLNVLRDSMEQGEIISCTLAFGNFCLGISKSMPPYDDYNIM